MEGENQTEKIKGESPVNEMKGGRKADKEFYVQLAIVGILAVVIVFSFGKIYGGGITGAVTGIGTVSAAGIIPTGTPAVYGQELGISYDGVSSSDPRMADTTIKAMGNLDRTLELSGADLERYIKIASQISCEYCCGAKSIIFDDGKAACGCAHSYAMRGLGKYLVLNHPDMSDDEILSELGKWKVLFFPGIHEQKAQALEAQGIDSSNYINLASNLYRGIEKGQASGGGMVGGC